MKPVLVFTNNHFDPIWRRCWLRSFNDKDGVFASYAELEEGYMLENLDLAERNPTYKFEAESTVVVRQFLRRNPDSRQRLRDLAQEGRFAVSGAGDNIIDTNMVLGESIVRNFLTGLLWSEETLGVPAKVAVRNDAFGNSAQLPQILRECELPWATGFSYSQVQGEYWRGLDGSIICTAMLPCVGSAVDWWTKYPPCRECRGTGCEACDDRGYAIPRRCPLPELLVDKLNEIDAGEIGLPPEEMFPNPAVLTWIRELDCDARFALGHERAEFLESKIARVDDPPADLLHPSPELNPNNTGCYVTRIKTKQACRRQEYALLAVESLATLNWANGRRYPQESLSQAWEKLLFTMFHDAITATHIDAAYDELQDMWRDIDALTQSVRQESLGACCKQGDDTRSVVNMLGHSITECINVDGNPQVVTVPPMSSVTVPPPRELAVETKDDPVIVSDRFRIVADEHGLVSIDDLRLDKRIAETMDGIHPGELILEEDCGTPWATVVSRHARFPVGPATKLCKVEHGQGFQRMQFRFSNPSRSPEDQIAVPHIEGSTTVTLVDGLDRIDFVTELEWDSISTRLRAAFPTSTAGAHIYGIPYGILERKPYEPNYIGAGANGDWPAINWAGIEGEDVSLALLSKGLVSYKVEEGILLLSLLRSPTMPGPLHEPTSYTMTAWQGMRDAGHHRLEYSLTAYRQPFAESSVVLDAAAYNAGLHVHDACLSLPEAPVVESDVARLAAIKRSEDGNAVILRLAEFRGQGGDACVCLPQSWSISNISRVNVLERNGRDLPIGGTITLNLKPWQIVTVRVDLGDK